MEQSNVVLKTEGVSVPTRVLVLCTGNSCRSQIAEGYLKHLGQSRVLAASAGIEAHGLNPRAVQVMSEDGVDISEHCSTIVDEQMIAEADLIITVCGHADRNCPVIPSGVKKRHIPFDDPAKAVGSEAEVMAAFRQVRDEIRRAMIELISNIDRV